MNTHAHALGDGVLKAKKNRRQFLSIFFAKGHEPAALGLSHTLLCFGVNCGILTMTSV